MPVNRRRNILFFIMLFFLSSCAPGIVGGMLVTTSLVGESRAVDSHLEDEWAAMKILSYFVRSELVRAGNIGVSVYNGKVLLTGSAASQEEIDEAIRIAQGSRGISEVRSEIQVQYVSVAELAMDALITHKVKIQLLADRLVNGLDIHVKTTKGVVYLTGSARTIQVRDQAIGIARQVSDVREVVSYIDINPTEASGNPEN